MKLKEWMIFNKPFIFCDLQIVLIKYGSYHKDNILFEGITDWDIAERLFGDFEIKKLSIGEHPTTKTLCFRIILWDDPKESK